MSALRRLVRTAVSVLGLACVLSTTRESLAQHTPDPFNIVGEYNRQYEPFMYASEPNSEGFFPNQGRLNDRAAYRTANRYQSYLAETESGIGSDFDPRSSGRARGAGSPFFRARARVDQSFDRTYRPNEEADKGFYTERQQLNDKYFQAMGEKDPKKRAQLFREYNIENLRAARSFSTVRASADRERERESLDSNSNPNGARNPRSSLLDGLDEEPSRATEPKRPTGEPATGSRSNSSSLPGLRSRSATELPRAAGAALTPRRGEMGLGAGRGLGPEPATGPNVRGGRLPRESLDRNDPFSRLARPATSLSPGPSRSRTRPLETDEDPKP